jgi:hypothetical protein
MENCELRGAAAFFMSASPTLSHDAPVHEPPDRRFPWQEQQSPRLCSVGRPLPKNTIRFKCVDCGRPMEARAQDGGSTRIARIARRPLPCRGFHQIRTSVQLKTSSGK